MVLSVGGWEEEMKQSSDSHEAGEDIITNKIRQFSVFRESTETSEWLSRDHLAEASQ